MTQKRAQGWRGWLAGFGPVVLWLGAINAFSTPTFSGAHTAEVIIPYLRWLFPAAQPEILNAVHANIRIAAHVIEYAVLALCWYQAVRYWLVCSQSSWVFTALALTTVTAGLDEVHQFFVTGRYGRLADWGWDCLGGLLGATLLRVSRHRAAVRLALRF